MHACMHPYSRQYTLGLQTELMHDAGPRVGLQNLLRVSPMVSDFEIADCELLCGLHLQQRDTQPLHTDQVTGVHCKWVLLVRACNVPLYSIRV